MAATRQQAQSHEVRTRGAERLPSFASPLSSPRKSQRKAGLDAQKPPFGGSGSGASRRPSLDHRFRECAGSSQQRRSRAAGRIGRGGRSPHLSFLLRGLVLVASALEVSSPSDELGRCLLAGASPTLVSLHWFLSRGVSPPFTDVTIPSPPRGCNP